MQTILKSETKTVTIDTDGPFTIIGEKINPTGRKKLAAALTEGNYDYVRDLALKQVAAGADILDVNVGVPGADEVALLPEVVKIVQDTVDVPICIDSANREALAAALAVMPGRPLVNSVNGEEASLQAVLPVIKDFDVNVIGLTLDENGIPEDPESRLAVAEKIIIDPLVLTVGADSRAGWVTLETCRLVREHFGVNINLGASNVSFGLPDRETLNKAFLALGIGAGATCAITDPIKLTGTIKAADLLRGRDSYGAAYIKHFRQAAKEQAEG
jgi:5-methyltetrahydrofolate--homocysteine methyltransferase